jgi:hypothetical protein
MDSRPLTQSHTKQHSQISVSPEVSQKHLFNRAHRTINSTFNNEKNTARVSSSANISFGFSQTTFNLISLLTAQKAVI